MFPLLFFRTKKDGGDEATDGAKDHAPSAQQD
jgi:hypothetical protein